MKRRLIFVAITVITLVAVLATNLLPVTNSITKGLDLDGGFEIVYQVTPLNEGDELPTMESVIRSINKRIDTLGVSEPQITIEGSDRIRIQLAGVSDMESAQNIISTTANLSFRDIDDNLLMDASVLEEGGASLAYNNGVPIVSLSIADSELFSEVTGKLAAAGSDKNLIVTWLDFEEGVDSYAKEKQIVESGGTPKYISAASVSSAISGDAIIQGNFTVEQARELADLINAGSLPVQLNELYSNVVSAEYGQNAYNVTMFAGVIGVLAVMIFMIIFYRLSGLVAAIVLAAFVFFNILIFNMMGGVLTLSGIAALILGVGMTVDANVITFERIKDELYLGRTVKKAYKEGSRLAFRAIFDSQFTTFIAAVIMYAFGTGAVKGFATMFMITIFCTLTFTILLTKIILGSLVNSGILDNKKTWFAVKLDLIPDLTKREERKYFGPFKNVDFVKGGKKLIFVSLAIILIGMISSVINVSNGNGPLNLGIDFVSGTNFTITSDETLSIQSVNDTFSEFGYEPSKVQITNNGSGATVTLDEAVTDEAMDELKGKLTEFYGTEPNDNTVTPVVGKELINNAIILSLVAWLAMMLYISFRFKWDYGIACVVALLHDVAITIAIFAIFRFEFNSELIAVILAIIGYSINDSIVIFDRIRENIDSWKKPTISNIDYTNIVNLSLQQTAMRSLFNTITTVLPIIFLLTMGSSEIFTFNIAIFIGLIAGAYSSLFVAAQLWLYIRNNYKPKVKAKKVKKKLNEPTEMTVIGIND
ncbi:MAG: protein translocase subunit SecD [Erysipelotrichaceae bacterium]